MNIMQIMQQAKQMQGKMAEMQERMADVVVTGTAGGGAVTVAMTCKGRVESVRIAPTVVDLSDIGMLEDLVKAACNDARAAADEKMADETRKMMDEMGLPANVKLPF